ncbi:hypothetical protein O181_023716 [Austropuccinia psidii MF-1]|uniref:RNase H type-1 domain-containing protein n=1 Tax=Austropuccinia psidii MF-1 TaxID=1389203 RepID=A0A9Q3GXX5_9BASI|nr:hypothetical protein [Austropuccinia psidii MF-1]
MVSGCHACALGLSHRLTGIPLAVAIFSDSQEALKCITLPKKSTPGQQLTTRIYNKFQFWLPDFLIKLYWCPGHLAIQQNKEVDKLVKEAVNSKITSPHTLHHISLSILRQATNKQVRTPPHLQPQNSPELHSRPHQP